jgi:hypothetical protein
MAMEAAFNEAAIAVPKDTLHACNPCSCNQNPTKFSLPDVFKTKEFEAKTDCYYLIH